MDRTKFAKVAEGESDNKKYKGVGFRLPEYEDELSNWDLLEDTCKGESAIKASPEWYIPPPVPFSVDPSPENVARYETYVERAVFWAVTKRTLHGLTGQVFKKDPVLVTDNEDLAAMAVDIDGSGITLDQQAQKTLSEVLKKGRSGLFVDFPTTEGPVTAEDQKDNGVRPVIVRYDAKQVINWRTRAIGSENRISLVVIVENHITEDDGFEPIFQERWKVLKLNDVNVYEVEHYLFDEEKGEFYQDGDTITPTKGDGSTFNYIPFMFVGSTNNDVMVDVPPLLDIASLNIAHLRNSADYEEMLFICGQATPWAAGLDKEWAEDLMDDNIQLGSRKLILLPQGGSAGLLQVESNDVLSKAMKDKEEQMIKLGAKLVDNVSVQRTATDALIQEVSETSVLHSASVNVSSAYTICISFIFDFLSIDFDPESDYYELNTDFEITTMTPQEQQALIASWMSGGLLDEEMRERFQKAGIATKSFEEWSENIDNQIGGRGAIDTGGGSPEDEDV